MNRIARTCCSRRTLTLVALLFAGAASACAETDSANANTSDVGTAVPILTYAAPSVGAMQDTPPARYSDDWREGWRESANWGGRIGYVDDDGILWVKLKYYPDRDYVSVAYNVVDFQLLDWRIAIRKHDRSLWIGEGTLAEPLKRVESNVDGYQLTLSDLGILTTDGTLSLKRQGFAPRQIAKGVRSFQIENHRLGLLGGDGSFWMRQLRGEFRHVDDNVSQFQLELDWVAYVKAASDGVGELRLARWDWNTASQRLPRFEKQANDVRSFAMEVTLLDATAESRLHIAAINSNKQMMFAEGTQSPMPMIAMPQAGRDLVSVQWSGHQLTTRSRTGTIRLARLASSESLAANPTAFSWLEPIDSLAFAYVNAEGNFLVARGTQLELLNLSDLATRGLQAAAKDLTMSSPASAQEQTPLTPDAVVVSTRLRPGGQKGAVQLSSLRPAHVRAPVVATTARLTASMRPTFTQHNAVALKPPTVVKPKPSSAAH